VQNVSAPVAALTANTVPTPDVPPAEVVP